jgi:hypothetical protein
MELRMCAAALAFFCTAAAACHGPTPTLPLAAAAWDGRAGDVRQLLAGGLAPDTLDGAWTPLMYAARRGHLDVMQALLGAGADKDRIDGGNRWTPLMHALHTQAREAARLLLDRGANPAIGTHDGFGPLAMAALDNDTEMIRAILARGVPPDHGARALDIAISGGTLVDIDRPLLGACYADAVSVLLDANPRVAPPGDSGMFSPLWWARAKRCNEVIRLVEARRALKTPRG